MSQEKQFGWAADVEDAIAVDGSDLGLASTEPSPEYVIEDHELICSNCHGTGINIHKPGREPCPCCDGEGFHP